MPRTGVMASTSSILMEDFRVLPEFSISVSVLKPSQKSWEITAIATTTPKPNWNWKLIPIASPSRKPCEQNSRVVNTPIVGRKLFLVLL